MARVTRKHPRQGVVGNEPVAELKDAHGTWSEHTLTRRGGASSRVRGVAPATMAWRPGAHRTTGRRAGSIHPLGRSSRPPCRFRRRRRAERRWRWMSGRAPSRSARSPICSRPAGSSTRPCASGARSSSRLRGARRCPGAAGRPDQSGVGPADQARPGDVEEVDSLLTLALATGAEDPGLTRSACYTEFPHSRVSKRERAGTSVPLDVGVTKA